MISIAVAVSLRDIITAACVNRTRPVADATLIVFTDTVVFIITNSVSIGVRSAIATAHVKSVELVAVTVAVADWNVRASALVDLAGAIAHAASVKFADTVVHVVTDAIHVSVRCA